MATYTIIGGDQKEYGPITADDVRKWIAEGRLNAHSQVLEEGDSVWRPLSTMPEFASALAAKITEPITPPSFGLSEAGADGVRDAALQQVKGPAIGLKVTAIVGLVLVVVGLVINILTLKGVNFGMQQLGDPQMQRFFNTLGGGLGIVQNIIGALVCVIILLGASRMQALRNYQFALTASILAMLPCISPCCIFGLPFGIWALVVLHRPNVKSQFS